MSKRSDGLIIESLGNGWNMCTTGANVTVSCSVSPAIKARAHLTQLGWSIKNLTGAASTVAIHVRDASIAGTILAQWQIMTANGATNQDTFAVNIQGLRGSPLNIATDTVVASLTLSINTAGWLDTLGDG